MAEANDTMGILYENLVDAGCDEQDTKCCMEMAKQDRWIAMLPTLKKHRTELLDEIHDGQGKLECLDYLIYRIGREYGK